MRISLPLRIAAFCPATHALGPGLRAVVWVQGCPFRCMNCISPEWIPVAGPARITNPSVLLEELLVHPQVSGLTLSGGEPFLQAGGLAQLVELARQKRDLDIICFTGYSYETLIDHPPSSETPDLLKQIDVLIDGPYIQRENKGAGLRGSSNQRIIHLTSRLKSFDFENMPRRFEIMIQKGEALLVGIPPAGVAATLKAASNLFQGDFVLPGGNHERP